MKVNIQFEITSMQLDGHDISIPKGFSEIMNRSGAWKYEQLQSEDMCLKGYERKVRVEDGKLRTYLTYKGSTFSKVS